MDAQQRRNQLYGLLGDLPERNRPISAKTLSTSERDGYVLETLALDLNGLETVPAYFVKPMGATGKLPVVLYNHCHGGKYGIGKNELIEGHPGVLLEEPYAIALTRAGYAVLCIDAWCFGGRNHASEHDTVKAFLWQGRVMWGMMVYDSLKALDYLHTRDDVDTTRVATFGMSMGSTMAWWAAALDERIKVCVELCCLVDFQALLEAKLLSMHNFYYYVPGLLKYFTSAEIVALIAPRSHLACVGEKDPHVPSNGVERIDAHLRDVYAKTRSPQAWQLRRYDCGHEEIPAMRAEVLSFLKQAL